MAGVSLSYKLTNPLSLLAQVSTDATQAVGAGALITEHLLYQCTYSCSRAGGPTDRCYLIGNTHSVNCAVKVIMQLIEYTYTLARSLARFAVIRAVMKISACVFCSVSEHY